MIDTIEVDDVESRMKKHLMTCHSSCCWRRILIISVSISKYYKLWEWVYKNRSPWYWRIFIV